MVSLIAGASRLVTRDILARYLGRALIHKRLESGLIVSRPMSMREIERLTGVRHQRISDFLRDPLRVLPSTFERMTSLLDDPRLRLTQRGERVVFVDPPRFTAETLRDVSIPEGSQAVRFISETEQYPSGFRSTPWLIIEDDLAQQALDAVGSYTSIARLLFDVSD